MSKNKWDRQTNPTAPQPAPGQLANQSAQAAQAAAQPPQLPPSNAPSAPVVTIPSGALMLVEPVIELGAHIFVGSPPTDQTNRLKPKKAYVFQGAIVIEELNLILPLAGNYIRTR